MIRSDILDEEVARGMAAYSVQVTPLSQRRSGLYLTKFEVARIVGERAKQIANGAALSLPSSSAGRDAMETAERTSDPRSLAVDPVMMAKYDLVQKRIPMLLRRTWPDGSVETIPVKDLMVDITMLDLQY